MIAQARITSDTRATVHLASETIELRGAGPDEVRARIKQVFINASRRAAQPVDVMIVEGDTRHHLQIEPSGRIASRSADDRPVYGPGPGAPSASTTSAAPVGPAEREGAGFVEDGVGRVHAGAAEDLDEAGAAEDERDLEDAGAADDEGDVEATVRHPVALSAMQHEPETPTPSDIWRASTGSSGNQDGTAAPPTEPTTCATATTEQPEPVTGWAGMPDDAVVQAWAPENAGTPDPTDIDEEATRVKTVNREPERLDDEAIQFTTVDAQPDDEVTRAARVSEPSSGSGRRRGPAPAALPVPLTAPSSSAGPKSPAGPSSSAGPKSPQAPSSPAGPSSPAASSSSAGQHPDGEVPASAHARPTLQDLQTATARPVSAPPTRGWQAFVHRATGGVISPDPGKAELVERDNVARIRKPLDGPRNIAVVNLKGGAHKTTASLMIAATLGVTRGGSVLAWDNNETRGTLAWRGAPSDHHRTALDMLHDLDHLKAPEATVSDLDRYVRAQDTTRFDILASDEDPGSAALIDGAAFETLNDSLSRFYRLKVIDTGNNVRASNWLAAVRSAHQLVIISTVREDTFNAAAWMIDELRATGLAEQVDSAVTVLSHSAKGSVNPVLKDRLISHFGAHTRAVTEVPFERQFVDGSHLDWTRVAPATKEAWLAATALIVDGL